MLWFSGYADCLFRYNGEVVLQGEFDFVIDTLRVFGVC